MPRWSFRFNSLHTNVIASALGTRVGVCDNLMLTARNSLILKRRDVGVVDRARLESVRLARPNRPASCGNRPRHPAMSRTARNEPVSDSVEFVLIRQRWCQASVRQIRARGVRPACRRFTNGPSVRIPETVSHPLTPSEPERACRFVVPLGAPEGTSDVKRVRCALQLFR
jgi:hypothetical protein